MMKLTGKIIQAVPRTKSEKTKLQRLKVILEKYNFAPNSFEPDNFEARTAEQELQFLSESDVIIIDLSHERPSCYYELALAEIAQRPTIVFASVGTEIFQKSPLTNVHFYSSDSDFLNTVEKFLSGLPK